MIPLYEELSFFVLKSPVHAQLSKRKLPNIVNLLYTFFSLKLAFTHAIGIFIQIIGQIRRQNAADMAYSNGEGILFSLKKQGKRGNVLPSSRYV